MTKTLIWLGIFIGSTLGSFIPLLWGEGLLSFSSIIFSGIGGFLGLWAGYKLGQNI